MNLFLSSQTSKNSRQDDPDACVGLLDQNVKGFTPESEHGSTSSSRLRKLLFPTLALIILAIPASLFAIRQRIVYECGSLDSIDRNKCIFEEVNMLWMPKECYDEDLDQEFRGEQFKYYTTVTGDTEVDFKSASTMIGSDIYVSSQWHLTHCTYLWKKLHRAARDNRPMDDNLDSYEHTVHCSKMLLHQHSAGSDGGIHSVSVVPGFAGCPVEVNLWTKMTTRRSTSNPNNRN
jgi:hypothetical protein